MAKLRRKDSIFGLHFDFHAKPENAPIGSTTTEETVQKIIDIIKPDFVQCDSKGHPGITSYPSKLGNAAPVIDKDVLKIWREVTEKNDVALYTHYSGIFDCKAVKDHPEWGVINNDGTQNTNAVHMYSPYAEEILIPQLCELAGKYKTDGVWVDGDCWGVLRDISPATEKAFFEATGQKKLPKERGDSYFDEYLDMLRKAFLDYLKKYTKKIHEKYPEYQIASNWAFTTYMPQSVCADVDYITGDVYALDVINHLKYESKFMSQQNIPWDLMSWGRSLIPAREGDPTGNGRYYASKTPVQLRQEASIVLAHGGAFQVYYIQNEDASVDIEEIKSSEGLAEFCRSRKPYCFHGSSRAEIAVLYSGNTAYKMANEAFGFMDGTLKFVWGNVALMSSLGLPVDFIHEDTLTKKINDYSLIVVPEWSFLDNKEQLLQFAENGGKLLILGSKAASLFENELGIKVDSIKEDARIYLESNGYVSSVGCPTDVAKVTNSDAEIIDYVNYDYRGINQDIGATVRNYGKGKIAGVYFDTGLLYNSAKDIRLSDYMKNIVNTLLPQKFVEVNGSRNVEVTALEKDGKLCINLVNTSGPHADPTVLTYDEVPKVQNITVKVKIKKPCEVYLEPQHRKLPFNYENGFLEVKIEELEMYDILVIE